MSLILLHQINVVANVANGYFIFIVFLQQVPEHNPDKRLFMFFYYFNMAKEPQTC